MPDIVDPEIVNTEIVNTEIADAEIIAECAGVSRVFGRFTAVDGVDLAVGPGEVVGLLGANGAGKTTLIRMLLGLLPVSGGSVRLFGQPPSRASRRRVGYLPQGLGLYDDLTIAENLAFSRAVFAGAVLARTGTHPSPDVPDALRRYATIAVRDLPLGVARRAAFAQVLAHAPELLLLDEPTSGVDPLARARLWETISQTAADGAGVIVTTHSMEEAEECTRLVVLAGGRVVAAGTAAQIVGPARTAVVRAADWAAALRRLEAAGLRAVLAGTALAGPAPAGTVLAGPVLAGTALAGPAPAGTALRVPGRPAAEVAAALGDLPASVTTEPATLEECFFELVAGR
jgi:ABC-2 type transport system ATP-binding protein